MDSVKRIWTVVRSFLFSTMNKQFLIFLFFLALSAAFWLSLALDDTYEKELQVPVALVQEPQNVVILTGIQDTIRVTVRDKGFALVPYMLGSRIGNIKFRFSQFADNETGRGIITSSDILKQLQPRLYTSTKVVSVKPDRMPFYFNYGQKKTVPVRLMGKVQPAHNFYLSHVSFWPQAVTVYASKRTLDSITYAPTQFLDITNFEDTVKRVVSLKKIRGVKFVPAQVHMGLYPDVLTEENVEVPITAVNMPEGKVLRTFPGKVTVRFVVGAKLFRSVHPDHFRVTADYNDIVDHPAKCPIRVKMAPRQVKNVRLEIAQVDYLVEQQ